LKQSILKQLHLKKHLKSIDFLKETCLQINKDLNSYSPLKILLTEQLLNDPLIDLTQQLSPIISELEKLNTLQSFIYRVDLPEKKYIAYRIKEIDLTQFSSEIIERCAQKVFLRWHFSNRLNH
jgi:hypothetical protein